MRWRAEEAAWCDRGETRLRRPGPRFSREDSPLPLRHWSFYCKRLVLRNICQVKKRRIVETRLSIFLFTGSLREGGCNQLLIMELSLLLGLLQFYLIRGGFTFKAKDEFLIHWWDVLQEVWLLTGLNGGHMTAYLVPGKRKDLGNCLSRALCICLCVCHWHRQMTADIILCPSVYNMWGLAWSWDDIKGLYSKSWSDDRQERWQIFNL